MYVRVHACVCACHKGGLKACVCPHVSVCICVFKCICVSTHAWWIESWVVCLLNEQGCYKSSAIYGIAAILNSSH